MSDVLETVLKDAIKKIIAEAMAESAAAGLSPAFATASTARAIRPPCAAIPNPAAAAGTGWERVCIAFKSLILGAFVLGTCGLVSAVLFPSNFARAANDWAWMQDVHRQVVAEERRHHVHNPELTSLNDPADPAVAACMAANQEEVPQKLTWADLANPSKLIAMYKRDVFLHADADDLTAIILFYELSRLAKGQPITLKDLPADFKNSLPCKWLPAFNAVTAQFPEPQPLPPVPVDFIGPFAPYFD
ncbi:MAG: hypothetical protein ACAH83_03150 [Alphaproteobacteria bacterium]